VVAAGQREDVVAPLLEVARVDGDFDACVEGRSLDCCKARVRAPVRYYVVHGIQYLGRRSMGTVEVASRGRGKRVSTCLCTRIRVSAMGPAGREVRIVANDILDIRR
jgi:hypothetical protein